MCVCVCLPTCVHVDSESNSVFRALPFFSFFFFYFSSILFTPPLFSSFFPHLSSIHFSPKIFPPSLMEGPSFFFSSIFFGHIFPLKFFPPFFLVLFWFSSIFPFLFGKAFRGIHHTPTHHLHLPTRNALPEIDQPQQPLSRGPLHSPGILLGHIKPN